MIATTPAAAATTTAAAVQTTSEIRTTPLWRTGSHAGLVAALATTLVAAVAMAADVPLEIDGQQIPLVGFAQLTLMATAVGVLVSKAVARWSARPQRTFIAATVALTALSFVPDLAIPATAATRVVLIATHLVAAAIVIPAVAGRLPARSH
jgi:hypothetical protein